MISTVLGADYQDGFGPSSFLWGGVMTSYFDQMFHEFRCENPKCGDTFKEVLRGLLKADEVACPKCGVAIDIRESKRTGNLGKDFDTASQLDAKARQKE